jgi:hypothetical protein
MDAGPIAASNGVYNLSADLRHEDDTARPKVCAPFSPFLAVRVPFAFLAELPNHFAVLAAID